MKFSHLVAVFITQNFNPAKLFSNAEQILLLITGSANWPQETGHSEFLVITASNF